MKISAETRSKLRCERGAFQNNARPIAPGQSLRRDASSKAQPYVLSVVLAGCVILTVSIAELQSAVPSSQWWALVALTLISGSAVLELPSDLPL